MNIHGIQRNSLKIVLSKKQSNLWEFLGIKHQFRKKVPSSSERQMSLLKTLQSVMSDGQLIGPAIDRSTARSATLLVNLLVGSLFGLGSAPPLGWSRNLRPLLITS
jgi:hypothetical protein